MPGSGPAGKALTYSILSTRGPTKGTATNILGSPTVTYQAGGKNGPDAFEKLVNALAVVPKRSVPE